MPIYFLQTGDGGPVKIGSTADVRARVQFLQCGSPERLRLLGVVDGDVFDERRVHRLLAAHRIRGEWFKPAPEVLAAAAAGREEAERIGIPDKRESLPRPGSGDGINRGVSPPVADSFAAILCARTKVLRDGSGLVQREMAELL